MKTRQEARLEVMRGTPPDTEWVAVRASDGEAYAYRFEGGKKGRGHLSVTLDEGAQYYTVRLQQNDPGKSKDKYAIDRVAIEGDKAQQLEVVPKDRSDLHATIYNKNEIVMQAYYRVIVRRGDGVTIDCDPMISNDPRRI